jgi:hypothetical protein
LIDVCGFLLHIFVIKLFGGGFFGIFEIRYLEGVLLEFFGQFRNYVIWSEGEK